MVVSLSISALTIPGRALAGGVPAAVAEFEGGRSAYLRGDDRAARAYFSKVIASYPSSAPAYGARPYLADLKVRSGDESGAGAEIDALRAQKPPEPYATRAELARGWLAAVQGNWTEAQAAFTAVAEAWQSGPRRVHALAARGWAALLAGRPELAQADFAAVAAMSDAGEDVRAHAGLGLAQSLFRQGKVAEAEAELEALRADLPQHTVSDDALRDLGWCRLASGDEAGAREEFDALSSLGGDSRFARPPTPGAEVWAHPLQHTPDELREGFRLWYRQSPRRAQGLDPLAALMSLADREAAAEVAEALAAVQTGVSP